MKLNPIIIISVLNQGNFLEFYKNKNHSLYKNFFEIIIIIVKYYQNLKILKD